MRRHSVFASTVMRAQTTRFAWAKNPYSRIPLSTVFPVAYSVADVCSNLSTITSFSRIPQLAVSPVAGSAHVCARRFHSGMPIDFKQLLEQYLGQLKTVNSSLESNTAEKQKWIAQEFADIVASTIVFPQFEWSVRNTSTSWMYVAGFFAFISPALWFMIGIEPNMNPLVAMFLALLPAILALGIANREVEVSRDRKSEEEERNWRAKKRWNNSPYSSKVQIFQEKDNELKQKQKAEFQAFVSATQKCNVNTIDPCAIHEAKLNLSPKYYDALSKEIAGKLLLLTPIEFTDYLERFSMGKEKGLDAFFVLFSNADRDALVRKVITDAPNWIKDNPYASCQSDFMQATIRLLQPPR